MFCTACGAQRANGTAAFCQSCGRPFDPPAAAETRPIQVPPPPTYVPPPPQGPPPAGPPGPPPPSPPTSPPTGPPAGRSGVSGRILLLVGGLVLALVAGAFVAWQFLWPRGGAASPEEAAENVMLAASEQDPVAMLDMVNPDEVSGLDDVYAAALERGEEEGVVEGDGITDAVSIELTDLEFDVDELGEDYARVTLVDGHYDVSFDPGRLPERLAELAADAEPESESGDFSDVIDGELGDAPSVITVRVDGRWYITALGTVADYAYRDIPEGEVSAPDYDSVSEDVEPIVGEEPEDVIANLAEAVSAEDVDQFLANLPEDLGRPLRPYAEIVQDAFDGEYGEGLDLEVSAEDLDLETEELDDGRLKVIIDSGTFSGTATEDDGSSSTGSVRVEGDCLEISDGTGTETGCLSSEPVMEGLGLTEFYVVMREVDGGYQLDPTGTYAQYAAAAVDGLTEDLIDDILRDVAPGITHEMEAVPVP